MKRLILRDAVARCMTLGAAALSMTLGAVALSMTLGAVALSMTLASVIAPPVARAQRQPKVIQLEEIKIEGRVQKPNAFYILNRSNIGYRVMELRTSFVHEVIRAVRREPF